MTTIDDAEKPMTKAEIHSLRERIENNWTDATHIPRTRLQDELCQHLASAAAVLDEILQGET